MNEINVIASFPSKTRIFPLNSLLTSSLSSSRSLTWLEQELRVPCFYVPFCLPRHSAFGPLLLNLALSLLMRKILLEGGAQERTQRSEGSGEKKGRARRQKGQRRQKLATVVMEARAFPRAMQISTCQPRGLRILARYQVEPGHPVSTKHTADAPGKKSCKYLFHSYIFITC